MPIRIPIGSSSVELRQALQMLANRYFDESSDVDHDATTNFVANEHIDHTAVSISAGTGLTGGGTIAANRTLSLSHLGLEALTDPAADRIFFWDESANAAKWLTIGANLEIADTVLNVTGIVIDHGALTGLADDDHTQYFLANGSRDITGQFVFSPATHDFIIRDNSVSAGGNRGRIAIQCQTAAEQMFLDLFTKDGDSTDDVGYTLYAKGSPTSITNRELLEFRYDSANTEFSMDVVIGGTGSSRPISVYTSGNRPQLYLDTNGRIGVLKTGPTTALDVYGTVTATSFSGANVTSGADPGHTHSIYLKADGTIALTGNMAVNAAITIDGRDISVDGAKLDTIETNADVTDAANVAAAGAAMAGGAFHDGFSDFVANEHIDWTAAASAFYTTSTGRFSGNLGVGAAPGTLQLQVHYAGTGRVAGFYATDVDSIGEEALIHIGGANTVSHYGVMIGAAPEASPPYAQAHAFIVKCNTSTGVSHKEVFRVNANANVGVRYDSTGTITNAVGVYIVGKFQGTGRVTGTVSGFNASGIISSGATAGTTTYLRAGTYNIDLLDAGTTVTYGVGLFIDTPSNSGTLTNTWAIFIGSQTDGIQTNTPFGIYQNGVSDFNYFGGKTGFNTNAPTAYVDINSDIIRLRTSKTPATAGATGNAGDICWDADFIYVCVTTNTWKKVAIATW